MYNIMISIVYVYIIIFNSFNENGIKHVVKTPSMSLIYYCAHDLIYIILFINIYNTYSVYF